jgi:hypothetical protein
MNILVFKLLATPFFISVATLSGRRWGPVVNGLLVGLPLTSGPVSFILASQYGTAFAAKAAAGNLAGQVAMCAFCLAYSLLARKLSWKICAPLAMGTFLATVAVLNTFSWQLLPAFASLVLAIVVVARVIPQHPLPPRTAAPPKWDLPARIILATTFVVLLTTFANILGPQLSGIISTVPIFGVIFASFAHFQQGSRAASNLLRGIVVGSLSYAVFFLVVGLCLVPFGIAVTYPLALIALFATSGTSYYLTQRKNKQRRALEDEISG